MKYLEEELDDTKIYELRRMIKEVFSVEKHKGARGGGVQTFVGIDNAILERYREQLKEIISELYLERGFGYKSLVNIVEHAASYTQMRKLFLKLGIDGRKGYHVVTNTLRSLRRVNAKRIGQFKNWTEKYPYMLRKSSRYLNGFLWNESKQKYVFLRSTWEYAYAKILTQQGKLWDVEEKRYLLNDGRIYLPDFFVYDQSGKLEYIVEIKSLYNYEAEQRLEKYWAFKEQYRIPTVLITDIAILESELHMGYRTINREWKKKREEYKGEDVNGKPV